MCATGAKVNASTCIREGESLGTRLANYYTHHNMLEILPVNIALYSHTNIKLLPLPLLFINTSVFTAIIVVSVLVFINVKAYVVFTYADSN